MNFLVFVDEIILFHITFFSRILYRIFGINNFKNAKIICTVGYLNMILGVFLKFSGIGWYTVLVVLFALVGFLPSFAYTFLIIVRSEKSYKVGFKNSLRISDRFSRVLILIFTVHLIYVIPATSLKSLTEFFGILLMWQSSIWGWSISRYFASIEPEDPTESLIKKVARFLRGLFVGEPLPQPA